MKKVSRRCEALGYFFVHKSPLPRANVLIGWRLSVASSNAKAPALFIRPIMPIAYYAYCLSCLICLLCPLCLLPIMPIAHYA